MDQEDFLSYFSADLFLGSLKASDRDGALKEMVDLAARANSFKDPTLVLDMLRRREELGSTGIGNGIAIPHGRTVSVRTLMAVYGRSDTGLDFDAIDDKPVNIVFMIIAPPQEQSNVYLPFLGKLVELLKSPDLRESLGQVKSYEAFVETLLGAF
jgi:PTS system nitrogen regulatory IIA component